MDDRSLKRRSPVRSWCVALTMMGLASQASAAPASLNLDYTCPMPLLGPRHVVLDIQTDLPASLHTEPDLNSYELSAGVNFDSETRYGFTLVGSQSVEAAFDLGLTLKTSSRELNIPVDFLFAPAMLPSAEGGFKLESQTSIRLPTLEESDEGLAQFIVGNAALKMTLRKADGALAPAPIGQFDSNCTLMSGQDEVLHTANVQIIVTDWYDIQAPAEVQFESVPVGATKEEIIDIVATGFFGAGIADIVISGPDASAFSLESDCENFSIDQQCWIRIVFRPLHEGLHLAQLTLNWDDPYYSSVVIELRGVGVSHPVQDIAVDPSTYNFGPVADGRIVEKTFTLTNIGASAIGLPDVRVDSDSDWVVHTEMGSECALIEVGGTCALTVQAVGSASRGHDARLVIKSDDPNALETEVLLQIETGPIVDCFPIEWALDGTTQLHRLVDRVLLTGAYVLEGGCWGEPFRGQLRLNPSSATMPVIGVLTPGWKATAKLEFVPVGYSTTSPISNEGRIEALFHIRVPEVTARWLGREVSLGGGSSCQTIEPVKLALAPSPLVSSMLLKGTYDIGRFANCGLATTMLNTYVAGKKKEIELNVSGPY